MSFRWPVARALRSACVVTEPSAPRRRIRRSRIETTSRSPSGSQPSPDGWPGTSSWCALSRRRRTRRRRAGRSPPPTSGRRASAGTRRRRRPAAAAPACVIRPSGSPLGIRREPPARGVRCRAAVRGRSGVPQRRPSVPPPRAGCAALPALPPHHQTPRHHRPGAHRHRDARLRPPPQRLRHLRRHADGARPRRRAAADRRRRERAGAQAQERATDGRTVSRTRTALPPGRVPRIRTPLRRSADRRSRRVVALPAAAAPPVPHQPRAASAARRGHGVRVRRLSRPRRPRAAPAARRAGRPRRPRASGRRRWTRR